MKRHRPGTVERAVIAAVRSAAWIDDDVDSAAVWTLRTLAADLDVRRRAMLQLDVPSPSRDLAEVAGRTIQLLRELGLSPSSRHRLELNDDRSDTSRTLSAVLDLAASRDSSHS